MPASRPKGTRRRPRRGSIERPVSGRLYRGTSFLLALPLLVAAFSVARPGPLQRPALPPAFDQGVARDLAVELATLYPDRSPGSPGSIGAAAWFARQLAPYGLVAAHDRFTTRIPGRGRVELENLTAVAPGPSPETIVVMAHRDDTGTGPGANDNASGTAALIELARSYASPAGDSAAARQVATAHTILFLSTDGGAFGGLGAARFAQSSPYRDRVMAVLNLDALAGAGQPRLELAGDQPRSPAAALVQTTAARVLEETGRQPGRPSGIGQLIDLAFPLSLYEQGPFVGRGIPAVTLTTGTTRPSAAAFRDRPEVLRAAKLAALGRAAQETLESLDAGVELAQGTTSYVYLGDRIVRGWTLELVLISLLLPFVVAATDLFARSRRLHIALRPAFRALASRLGFWLFAGLLFEAFGFLGVWPGGAARPPAPDSAAGHWPLIGTVVLALLLGGAWLVARERLLPRRPVTAGEEIAGHIAALLALAVVGLLVVSVNPFALVFLLPSLHAWLWLPQVRARGALVRAAVLAAGFAGPLLLLGSLAFRFGLGLNAPWYLAELVAIGYVPVPALLVVVLWAAVGAQLAALASGRYAPYPDVRERGPRGPIRELVRTIVLAARGGRRVSRTRREALGP